MVKNLWRQTTFMCGCHPGQKVPLEYNNKGTEMFYTCPKYLEHEPGEKACRNNLSFYDAEKILDKLSETMAKFEDYDLTNYAFTYKNIDCKVTKFSEDKVKIEIVNKKALN